MYYLVLLCDFWLYIWHLQAFCYHARVAQWVRSLDITAHTSLSPIRRRFAPGFVNYKKGCTRIAATSDKVVQLLAHSRWFSPASATTKTGRHDIAETLLRVALKHKKSIKIKTRQVFIRKNCVCYYKVQTIAYYYYYFLSVDKTLTWAV